MGSLSDCEAELSRKKKGSKGEGKAEKKAARVVTAAVGRRVVVTGTGADSQSRAVGTYRADGKIELVATSPAAAEGADAADQGAEAAEAAEGVEAGEATAGGEAGRIVSCNAFCQLAGNKNHKPLQARDTRCAQLAVPSWLCLATSARWLARAAHAAAASAPPRKTHAYIKILIAHRSIYLDCSSPVDELLCPLAAEHRPGGRPRHVLACPRRP